MRACVQRVSEACVTVNGEVSGRIERGLVVLLGVAADDTSDDVRLLATNDVHYVHETDYDPHDTLLCIQTGALSQDPMVKISFAQFETFEERAAVEVERFVVIAALQRLLKAGYIRLKIRAGF